MVQRMIVIAHVYIRLIGYPYIQLNIEGYIHKINFIELCQNTISGAIHVIPHF